MLDVTFFPDDQGSIIEDLTVGRFAEIPIAAPVFFTHQCLQGQDDWRHHVRGCLLLQMSLLKAFQLKLLAVAVQTGERSACMFGTCTGVPTNLLLVRA